MDDSIADPRRNIQEVGGAATVPNGETTNPPAMLNRLPTPSPHGANAKEPSPFSKPCDICQRRRDVLIRCQTDDTGKWNFVCTGKCWIQVSGGTRDGDRVHPFYKYGGTWKNKHEYVSGKVKGKAKAKGQELSCGFKGPHRRHGHLRPKTKKTTGEIEIGNDDGGSDIEVSDVDDDVVDVEDVKKRHLENHIYK